MERQISRPVCFNTSGVVRLERYAASPVPLAGKATPRSCTVVAEHAASSIFLIAVLKLRLIFAAPFGKMTLTKRLTEGHYLRDHEEEVERLMMAELVTRYTPVALDERSLKLKSAALVLLFAGHSDQEIKDLIIKAFNLESEEYAQNVLDYVKDHPDQNTWY